MVTQEFIEKYFSQIVTLLVTIEKKIDRMTTKRDVMDGDELLDNYDVCNFLGITKRTLQRYKQHGKIPYYMVKGVSYYKKSEVVAFLDKKKR